MTMRTPSTPTITETTERFLPDTAERTWKCNIAIVAGFCPPAAHLFWGESGLHPREAGREGREKGIKGRDVGYFLDSPRDSIPCDIQTSFIHKNTCIAIGFESSKKKSLVAYSSSCT